MIIPCRDIQDIILTSYIDGISSEKETALVNDHVNSCSACRAVLASSRNTQNILESAPELTPRADLWTDIREKIETPPRFRWAGLLALTPQRAAWAGFALLLILTVTTTPLLLSRGPFRQSNGPTETPLTDESAALISMINERERAIFSDDINLGTDSEYFLTNKGELI